MHSNEKDAQVFQCAGSKEDFIYFELYWMPHQRFNKCFPIHQMQVRLFHSISPKFKIKF